MKIYSLLEENRKIEKYILEKENEISFDLFLEWMLSQQKIGKWLACKAFCDIAKKHDAYVLSNPVNPSSYAHFIRADAQSKTHFIRKRTQRNGMCDGFLEPEESFNIRPLVFRVQEQQFYAVVRSDKECLVKEIHASDSIIKASCYEDNFFIISDIDLISIHTSNTSDIIMLDPLYGELTSYELGIIQDINQYFQNLVLKYCKVFSSFRLISHGPANRFSNSKASHLHCPFQSCSPQSVEFLGQADSNSKQVFLNFNHKMRSKGYHSYLNPNWKFNEAQ